MLHIDLPTRAEIEALVAERHEACVSIYLETTPVTQEAQKGRIALKNLLREALAQLRAADTPKRALWPIEEAVGELIADDGFWRYQARSLAIFATPERMRSYRLPNRIESLVEVADRFHVKPLLRAIAFAQSAFVLALAEGGVRLVEIAADGAPEEVHVPDLPRDMRAALGARGVYGRSPERRMPDAEGEYVRIRQYARAVDRALRPVLRGQDRPLILAAAEPIASIYPKVQSYRHLAERVIGGNAEHMSADELAAAAREILDARHAEEIRALHATFEARKGDGRATSDLAQAARAATVGAIETLIVDMDATRPGSVAADGTIDFAEAGSAASYGIVDEIAGRALATGARVVAARKDDLPAGDSLIAILRYPV